MKKISKRTYVLFGVFLISLLPIYYTIFHSMPSPDDFAMADIDRSGSLFVESVRLAVEYWFGWVGMWFASFYETFCNPLNLFSDIRGWYGFVMCLVFTFFLVSVFMLVRAVLKELLHVEGKGTLLAIFALTAFVLVNIDIYFEIFMWLCGSHYVVSISMGFIFTALLISHLEHEKGTLFAVLLSLLGLVTCSDYMVAVAVCVYYMFLLIHDRRVRHADVTGARALFNVRVVPLYFCVIGGASAVFAPGNFSRNSGMDSSSLSFWKAGVQNTLIAYKDFSAELVYNPLLFFGFALMMIFAYHTAKRNGLKLSFNPMPLIICLFTVPPVVLIPVALGYGQHDFPNRIEFVFNTYAISAAMAVAFMAGMILAEKTDIDRRTFGAVYTALFIGAYVSMVNAAYMADFPCVRMIRDRHETEDFSRRWFDILDEIKYSDDDDVVIETEKEMLYIDPDPLIKSPGLVEDPESGANINAARYYGKNSVTIVLKQETEAE
jgi:hypothetical protein